MTVGHEHFESIAFSCLNARWYHWRHKCKRILRCLFDGLPVGISTSDFSIGFNGKKNLSEQREWISEAIKQFFSYKKYVCNRLGHSVVELRQHSKYTDIMCVCTCVHTNAHTCTQTNKHKHKLVCTGRPTDYGYGNRLRKRCLSLFAWEVPYACRGPLRLWRL